MSSVGGRRPFRGLRRMLAALVRQRRRLALATVAIALGVGYLAGALTLLDRVAGGLDALAAAGAERADLVVEGGVAYESPLEQVRRLVPITVGQGVDDLPGVASTSPRIEDVAVLIGPNGTPLVAPGLSEQPLGANWPDDSSIAPYRFASGGPPTADDQVVIDQRSAERAGTAVGDTISVAGKAKVATYEVSGIIRTDAGGLPAGSSLALFTTNEARALFDRALDDNAVAVRIKPGADPAQVEGEIRRTLPSGIEVVDGPTAAVHRQESLTRSFTLVRSLILAFAALALIVGMVTVANSLALLYGERRRTFAALRLVGAKPRQLMTAALIEAGLLALVASLLGVPLGLLLGRLIEAALGALNTSVPVAGSIVSWKALAAAVVIGVVATVVAAVFPAARACRVPPIEAVTDAAVERPNRLRRSLLSVLLAALAAAAVTALLVLRAGSEGSVAVTAGVAGGVVAAIGLLPVVLSGLVAGGVRLMPVRPKALRRIAARDVLRNRTRTAATAAALIVATAVVAGLAVFLASFTASVDGEVKSLVTADLVVDSGTFTRGGLPADLLERLDGLDSVSAASGWQVGRASVGLTPLRLTGLDLGSFFDVLSPVWVGEPPTQLEATSILLSSATADTLGARVGDTIPVTFTSGGTETLRVAGIYDSGTLLLGEAVLDRSVLERQIPATTDIAALVTLDPDNAASQAQVKDLAASYGVTSVLEPGRFVDRRADLLRGFQRVIEWMLLFTLVQALVGVINTLLLSVGERRREFGLLRASGATRRQVLRLVLLEGISLAVVGTAFGLALGILGARLGIRALDSLGLRSFVVPIDSVLLTGVAALMLGILAAVVPARWASGVPPLEAVSDAGMLRVRPRREQRVRLKRRGRPAFHWEDEAVAALAVATVQPPPPFPPGLAIPAVPLPPPAPDLAPAAVASVVPFVPEPLVAPASVPVPVIDAPPPQREVAPAAAVLGVAGVAAAAHADHDVPPPAVPVGGPSGSAVGSDDEFFLPEAPVVPPTALPYLEAGGAEPQVLEPAAITPPPLVPPVAPVPPVPEVPAAVPPVVPVAPVAPVVPSEEHEPVAAPAAFEPSFVEPVVARPAVAEPLVPEPLVPEPLVPEPVAPEPLAPEPTVVQPPAAEPVTPEPVAAPEPEWVITLPPTPEPAVAAAPVVEPVDPGPFPLAPPAAAAQGAAAPQPAPMDEPAVAPWPEPDVTTPERRRRRPARKMADTSRRRRDRASGGAAEGWVTPEPEARADTGPLPGAAGTAAATAAASGLRFGPAAPSDRGAPAGHSPTGGTPAGGTPPPPEQPPPSRPRSSSGGDVGNGLADAVGRLDRRSVEEGAPALAILGGVLAPGERVAHLVQGRAKGLVCIVARTQRRVIVVADRPQRPLVESLPPDRTRVIVAAGEDDTVRMAINDGTRVLQLTGLRDRAEAAALARSRPDDTF